MDFNQKKEEVEARFDEAMAAAKNLNDCLLAMRSIDFPALEELDEGDRKHLFALGRELDSRVAFILRQLLLQHGNVLFL